MMDRALLKEAKVRALERRTTRAPTDVTNPRILPFPRSLRSLPQDKLDNNPNNQGSTFDPLDLSSSPITTKPIASSSSFPPPAPLPFTETKNYSRIVVLIAAALYGTNFACVKLLDSQVPIAAGAAVRFGIAALATSPFLFKKSTDPSSSSQWDTLKAGFEVGVWNSAGYLAQAAGLETTSASKSAFICSLAVVVVPILDLIFSGKKLSTQSAVGCVLALVGVGLLELPPSFLSSGSLPPLTSLSPGDVATFLQPLTFGVGFWRMEKAMDAHPQEALRLTASQLLAVATVR